MSSRRPRRPSALRCVWVVDSWCWIVSCTRLSTWRNGQRNVHSKSALPGVLSGTHCSGGCAAPSKPSDEGHFSVLDAPPPPPRYHPRCTATLGSLPSATGRHLTCRPLELKASRPSSQWVVSCHGVPPACTVRKPLAHSLGLEQLSLTMITADVAMRHLFSLCGWYASLLLEEFNGIFNCRSLGHSPETL